MTEACSSLTFVTLYDPTRESVRQQLQLNDVRNSNLACQPEGICVGKPAPHVELRVCAKDASHIGRILTRGSHVMLGYWGQTNKTSDLAGENWLDTGDIGHIDDHGNVWLIGRSKGRIKSGGENIYPEEVSTELYSASLSPSSNQAKIDKSTYFHMATFYIFLDYCVYAFQNILHYLHKRNLFGLLFNCQELFVGAKVLV